MAADEPTDNTDNKAPEQNKSLTFGQMVASVLAAAFGVQSSSNRQRDFSRGKPLHFIALGLIFTVLFVLTVIGVVSLVLGSV